MANQMLIEADHMSELARESVLRMAKAHRYPLVSSHTGTGGAWTPGQLRELYSLGGMAAATSDTAPELAAKIETLKTYRSKRHYFGVGLGTDTGGFSSLPGPRPDAAQSPLAYPFRSFRGRVLFRRSLRPAGGPGGRHAAARPRRGSRTALPLGPGLPAHVEACVRPIAHADVFSATAARISAFSASSSISSPSWRSMARLVLPWRLALKRPEGSSNDAPLAKVIFTAFL